MSPEEYCRYHRAAQHCLRQAHGFSDSADPAGILPYLYENEMRLEFLSKSNNEAFARITVAAFASQLDPTIEQVADIKTAVSEAVTNCIIHAYEEKEGICLLYTSRCV